VSIIVIIVVVLSTFILQTSKCVNKVLACFVNVIVKYNLILAYI